MKKNTLFLLLQLLSFFLYGQKAANVWYFGNKAGLDFNTGSPPTPLLNGEMNTREGCASIADASGNLLFYTDGLQVWGRNHLVMPNGSGLLGDASSTQSAIITPVVGNKNRYYIFTTDGITCSTLGPKGAFDGLNYSVVDITLNSGNGDVVTGFKNRGLVDTTREQVTAARHANGIDYWIITRKAYTNKYYAFLVSCNGVDSANPVITTIGSTAAANTSGTSTGYLKASPQSDAILSSFAWGYCEVYDFDNATGRLSNARGLNTATDFYYGASFSPDGKVLYICGGAFLGGSKIVRYERFPTASATTVSSTEMVSLFRGNSAVMSLQLAPDGKIYFTHPYFGQDVSLGVIHDPNNYVSPNIQYTYVGLGGRQSIDGLPNFFDALHFYHPPIAGRDTTICSGKTAQIGTPPVTGLNYFWIPATGLSNAAVSNPIASPSVTTQYIMGAYNSCDTIYDTVLVNVLPVPVVNTTPSSSLICEGNSVTLTASGAVNYTWSPAIGLSSSTAVTVVAAPTISTNYSVIGTGANGCTSSVVVSVTVSPLPIVSVNPAAASICNGNSVTLTAFGAVDYTWFPSAGLSSTTGNVVISSPGTTTLYSLLGRNNDGCIDSTHIQITVLPVPTVIAGPVTADICSGNSVAITASGASSYTWSPSAGLNSITGDNILAAPSVTTTYSVIASGANGCVDSATVQINVLPLPVVSVLPANSTICKGDSILLTASGAGSYVWSPITNLHASSGSMVYAYPSATTVYTVLGTDAKGCSAITTATVNVPMFTPLVASITGNTSLCLGDNITLTSSATGGTGNYVFLWNHSSTVASITIAPIQQTNYWVRITDDCGGTDSASVEINVHPLPIVNFAGDDTVGCGGVCVNYNATIHNNAVYSWHFGDGNISSASNSVQHCYDKPGIYTVSLSVVDNNGCRGNSTKNNYIQVYPVPVAAFTSSTQEATPSSPSVQFTDQSDGAVQWEWAFGEGTSISTQQHPGYTYSEKGRYKVTLLVSNEYGCTDSSYTYITMGEDRAIYIPNTFTPNEDGINDLFFPKLSGIDVAEYTLLIYDRWGNLIFQSNTPDDGWDGKIYGRKVQQDVYVWKLSLLRSDNIKMKYTGHINVLR